MDGTKRYKSKYYAEQVAQKLLNKYPYFIALDENGEYCYRPQHGLVATVIRNNIEPIIENDSRRAKRVATTLHLKESEV